MRLSKLALEVTSCSDIFKLVHFGTLWFSLVPFICDGLSLGNNVLSISRLEWAKPAQFFMMAQSLDASVSSLMSYRLVRKSFVAADV